METKSYTISFFGLDPQYYTNAKIGDIWNIEAIKVYQETGISIQGRYMKDILLVQILENLTAALFF
ncbi:hypothetical protein [Anaerocolumna jejuensis]|uniref:hypothetical protein n=1 Tax=Anaerocolumna jejuensis TaxID=259063 RepID=UPI00093368F6|nr:hypothetical protein [Anaerocolumna jejuensis]